MSRKKFDVILTFNGKRRYPLIIDSHFKESHPEMSYEVIVQLVKTLDGAFFEPQEVKGEWHYYAIEPVFMDELPYRLILVTHETELYLGVVNAFRVRKKRYEK